MTFAIGRSVGPVTAPNLPLRGRAAVRRYSSLSSNREEIGALGLVSAWTIRATAAECLRPVTSQAIRKHLRDRGVGAGVAPEFMAERNSELIGNPATERLRRRGSEIGDLRTSPMVKALICFGVATHTLPRVFARRAELRRPSARGSAANELLEPIERVRDATGVLGSQFVG
ncbi:MAG TPA: hypothetical protein VGY54_27980, partial [Polyangiaceae bacterium]|nr:hypothetical protein [Polyangiaceae bacterium]